MRGNGEPACKEADSKAGERSRSPPHAAQANASSGLRERLRASRTRLSALPCGRGPLVDASCSPAGRPFRSRRGARTCARAAQQLDQR
eukprot:4782447-Pleurochrysis_carterae.AAC.1